MAAEKLFRLGIKRDDQHMYFVKADGVWAVQRPRPGTPRGKPFVVAQVNIEMDYAQYLYFLDSDGDVVRTPRRVARDDSDDDAEDDDNEANDAPAAAPAAEEQTQKPASPVSFQKWK